MAKRILVWLVPIQVGGSIERTLLTLDGRLVGSSRTGSWTNLVILDAYSRCLIKWSSNQATGSFSVLEW